MKDYNDMTPIELNVLINKTKENQENLKSDIFKLLDEVENIEIKINSELIKLKDIEDEYVELMAVLMNKQ